MEAIKEFKQIYYKEFGERISDEDDQEMGENLFSSFRIVYQPILKDDEQRPEDK